MKRLLVAEPTLLSAALRVTLTGAVLFGLDLTPEQVAICVAIEEAWLALIVRVFVTPEVKAAKREAAAHKRGADDLLELQRASRRKT